MFAGRLETSGMIIVLFGHRVPDVPENEGSISDLLRIVHGDRGCGAVAKQMRRDASAESRFGANDDPVRKNTDIELGSQLRHP